MPKDGPDRSAAAGALGVDRASKVGRRIAIVRYIAQGRPEWAVTARVLSQPIAKPIEGTQFCLTRTVGHLA